MFENGNEDLFSMGFGWGNGNWLDFGHQPYDKEVTEGMTATNKGQPANGKYIISDSITWVFTTGTLTKIKISEKKETFEEFKFTSIIHSVEFMRRHFETQYPGWKPFMRIGFQYPPDGLEYFKELISRN